MNTQNNGQNTQQAVPPITKEQFAERRQHYESLQTVEERLAYAQEWAELLLLQAEQMETELHSNTKTATRKV